VGARLIAGLRALGSPLGAADLAAHATELTAPLGCGYAGVEVLTTPPNSQGRVLLGLLAAPVGDAAVPDPLGPERDALVARCGALVVTRD
jgi:gamma-glutamyltranspeptidase/glutathione hydrolase